MRHELSMKPSAVSKFVRRLQLPEVDGHSGLRLRSPSAHMRSLYQRQYLISGACACVGGCALEEMATRKWLWHTICFQNGEQPQTPITNLGKQGLHGEPRLAAGMAADDGGRHGESD